jgi:hypothetical protein
VVAGFQHPLRHTYCLRLETNIFFYLHVPLHCLDLYAMAALDPPAWQLMPRGPLRNSANCGPIKMCGS